ncbi:hypothetical protein KTC92_14840 [Clostridium sp. CM027]|uniref:glycosyltransferase n=1 Tax=Clostridium sp. CM027 TaxID=2849865 RepID=UPI001C6DDEB9|nr:glycosyltransferase [Clostridium sp. CM027]MBW9145257.1 hypothetical protein [Clostridium sp. CM027]UVE40389.1 hypothetical protein KTC92_14840 [Clostridium sp. CM027]
MIFVTVGTHEQSFDRLVEKIDELVNNKIIKEEVFIQTGYTKYTPKYCSYKDMITSDKMLELTKKARIVITHGGPGSIMLPFQLNKIPVVVPRQKEFKEHVDNHQVKFTEKLEENQKIIAVYNIELLGDVIVNYDKKVENMSCDYNSTTSVFVKGFEKICIDLVGKDK